jgi:hypothetical protein
MSLAQFVIAGNWLLEINFRQKFRMLSQNKTALMLMSLYFLHVVGLIYTTDYAFAMNDLRTKLPLLLFPFLMATSKPLSKKQINYILLFVYAATIVSSLISLSIFLGITGKEITDIRQISPLISHIRLALLVCVSIGIACYFYVFPNHIPMQLNYQKSIQFLAVISIVWLMVFLIILESLTGILLILSGIICFAFYQIFRVSSTYSTRIKFGLFVLLFSSVSYLALDYLMKPFQIKEQVQYDTLPQKTAQGNNYTHHIDEKFTENGHYYGIYQCEEELRAAWNKRSKLSYDATDNKQQALNFTLMRYLTSRGLTKDAEGVAQLSEKDIKLIEQGITNYKIPFMNPLESRAYQVYCEYQSYRDGYNASGHSLTMRLHYWQAASLIIKENILFGVGTGDTELAFQQKYNDINSPLNKEWRHRAHNQYLTIMLTFGLPGILFFLAWLFVPCLINRKTLHPVYYAFMFVFLMSMLTEDTLETQAGVSFAVFFSCLFLLNPGTTRIPIMRLH